MLTVTMVRAGAAVTRVLNQKRMSGEGEQDKTRVRGHVHSMDAPGGGPKPASEECTGCRRKRLEAVKNRESRLYCREGVWTSIILVSPDHAAPYAGSQVFFPSGLIQTILHIFCKIIFLTKVGTSQMVYPQPLTN